MWSRIQITTNRRQEQSFTVCASHYIHFDSLFLQRNTSFTGCLRQISERGGGESFKWQLGHSSHCTQRAGTAKRYLKQLSGYTEKNLQTNQLTKKTLHNPKTTQKNKMCTLTQPIKQMAVRLTQPAWRSLAEGCRMSAKRGRFPSISLWITSTCLIQAVPFVHWPNMGTCRQWPSPLWIETR